MLLLELGSDLKTNLLVVGADIIENMDSPLHKKKYAIVEEVMEKYLGRDKDRTPELFFNALTFLYILGCIKSRGYKIKLVKVEREES